MDKSLYELLAESEESKHLSPAILSNIISAGKDYEAAIESALSEKVNSLIIEKMDDVFAAISIIKEKNLGKTSILYTDLCHKTADSPTDSVSPSGAGLIGRASDFISFESSEAQAIACAVLKDVFIVNDLSSAFELRKSSQNHELAFVTLTGELITADGFIIAGKGKEVSKAQEGDQRAPERDRQPPRSRSCI